MAVWTQTFTYRDAKGQTARLKFYVSAANASAAGTAVGNIQTAVQAVTNAALASSTGPDQNPISRAYGAAVAYEDVEDKAVLTFTTAAGDLHRWKVPAPLSTIFKPDGQTVDTGNTAVGTLTAAIIANASTLDGRAITAYIGGLRARVRNQRRMSIFTKSSDLATPAQ